MLRTLYIRDYALIDELEVAFDSGLNIITGETGAGKSILLGALSMILGERASPDVVRAGSRKAVVEGTFDEADTPRLRAFLEAHEIEAGPSIVLRREISGTGSRAFINDTPATLTLIREAAGLLLDLHGQHEHQSLLRTETHVDLLDTYGNLGGLAAAYGRLYREVDAAVRERTSLMTRERELQRDKERYAFHLADIDRVQPQIGEEEALEAEARVLDHAERLFETTGRLHALLYEGDNPVHDQLVVVRNELADLVRIDRAFEEQVQEIRAALISVSEVAAWLQDYNARIEFNPDRLELVRTRITELELLKRKYGLTLEAVLDYRREAARQVALADNFEAEIERLTTQVLDGQRKLGQAALRLSTKRREVAERIARGIEAELASLGMPHARFEVRFRQEPHPEGWVRLPDGEGEARFSAFANGMDRVEFFISANPGEAPKPLAKVASGGEVSRVMLSIKTVLAKSERMPILVFDEIDTGISGAVARKVGESMHHLAQFHQIIAITHLPQIAALGDVHFVVEKHVEEGRTYSRLRRLPEAERAEHIARLMAGDDLTEAALESARELMRVG